MQELDKVERDYIDNFDVEKEYELFKKENTESFIELEKVRDMLVDKILDNFIMNRIHPDYKEMVNEYQNLKEIEKENQELKRFITCLLSQTQVSHSDLSGCVYGILFKSPIIYYACLEDNWAKKILEELKEK